MNKYNKGDTFAIEIAEVHTHYTYDSKPYPLYRIKGFNSLVFDEYGLDKLKKIDNITEYKTNNQEYLNTCIVKKPEKSDYQKLVDKHFIKRMKQLQKHCKSIGICASCQYRVYEEDGKRHCAIGYPTLINIDEIKERL